MIPSRVAAIGLLVVGIVLFMVGMNAKDSFADRWSDFFTGRFTDSTLWYMIGGVAAMVIGIGWLVVGGRRT